jgi:hypothetical protein
MYICLCFSFLSQVLTRRGLVTTVSWKMRGLSAKRARSICGVQLLAGAVKEDYGAGPKMGHVTCRHVLPGVGSMGSPGWSVHCVRTGCSPCRDRCEDGRSCTRAHCCSLLFLLAVERMLDPQLLPLDEDDGWTEDLVWVV